MHAIFGGSKFKRDNKWELGSGSSAGYFVSVNKIEK